MKNDNTIRYPQLLPDVFQALGKINPAIDSAGLERSLHHLVVLRASQVNGCAHCVKMHTREARADGETNERLDRLVVWRHVDDYTPSGKAALAFTEAMTRPDNQSVLSALRAALRAHFSEPAVAAHGAAVARITRWKRHSTATHRTQQQD